MNTAFARWGAVAVAIAVQVACVDDVVVNTPKNGTAVDSTFPVDITWTDKVTGVGFKVDGADATSLFTIDANGHHATAKLTLTPGKHTIRAEGVKGTAPAYDEVSIQVGGYTVQLSGVSLAQGTAASPNVVVSRSSDTPGEVAIDVQGLPPGVVVWPITVPAGATTTAQIYFAAAPTAPIGGATATVAATATVNGAPVTQNKPLAVNVVGAPTGSPPPTWSKVYDVYFDGKTPGESLGHCLFCHDKAPAKTLFDPGGTKDSFYTALVTKGLVDTTTPASSKLIDVASSPLAWCSPQGKMPQNAPNPNVQAFNDIVAWVMSGAKNN